MIIDTITGVSTMEAKQRAILLSKENELDSIQRLQRSLQDVVLRQSTSCVLLYLADACTEPGP